MEPDIKLFDCAHLPDDLRVVSEKFRELALEVEALCPLSCCCIGGQAAEKATALRKLLEAKDAAVRLVVLARADAKEQS